MRNYRRVDAAGRLWSEDLPELLRGELTRELVARPTEMREEEVGRAVSAGLRARHALVAVTVVALSSGCGSSEPPAPVAPPVVAGLQLPVFEKSCAPQPGPASGGADKVVRAAIVANVCIGGDGPSPFLVDTGDATSLVESSLAARLHLAVVDGPGLFRHSPASGRSPTPLFPDGRSATRRCFRRPWQSEPCGPRPLQHEQARHYGSDTLSSFGAVRIDYRQQTLTLGPQGAPLAFQT